MYTANFIKQQQWHVFYIDKNNLVRQKSNSNATNVWVDGPVNKLNLQANNAPMVGMQACWYGNFYGDTDYVNGSSGADPHGTNPYLNNATAGGSLASEVGMHLWYGASNTSFEQYGWRYGDDHWTSQKTWKNMNARAGVGCYSWAANTTVTYAL